MTNFYIFDLFFIYRPKPGKCPCTDCCYWPSTGQELPGWTEAQCNANPANNFKWCGGSRLLRSSH